MKKDADKTKEELLAEVKELREFIDKMTHSDHHEHEQVKMGGLDVNNILTNLIEYMPDTVYVKDRNSRFVLCSNTVAQLMGTKSAKDVIGKTDFDFHDKEKAEEFRADELKIMESGEPIIGKDEQIIINGEFKAWVLTTKIPLRDDDGNVTGLIGIAHDISERKKLAEERDKVIKELQAALDRIKTLNGLLPICSWCKKIRKDDGYWEQVDVYIRDNSEADFTHGVCPDCVKKFSES